MAALLLILGPYLGTKDVHGWCFIMILDANSEPNDKWFGISLMRPVSTYWDHMPRACILISVISDGNDYNDNDDYDVECKTMMIS